MGIMEMTGHPPKFLLPNWLRRWEPYFRLLSYNYPPPSSWLPKQRALLTSKATVWPQEKKKTLWMMIYPHSFLSIMELHYPMWQAGLWSRMVPVPFTRTRTMLLKCGLAHGWSTQFWAEDVRINTRLTSAILRFGGINLLNVCLYWFVQ